MTKRTVTNVAASVRQRLLNRARTRNRPFGEILQYYAMERFLYRLTVSPYAVAFVLKGAMMLRARSAAESRPTMDIDLLGMPEIRQSDLSAMFREILNVNVTDDGLRFNTNSVQLDTIPKNVGYDGVRVRFHGTLDSARIAMQIDIGFGDIVYPNPEPRSLSSMLDDPPPTLLCYTLESAIAEKLEAAVKLGSLNSRMKDFYDVWMLSRSCDFSGETLAGAILETFRNRKTPVPRHIHALTDAFVEEKRRPWEAFRRRSGVGDVPESFDDLIGALRLFLTPVFAAATEGERLQAVWKAPGPWK